jgi:hypothetical protein
MSQEFTTMALFDVPDDGTVKCSTDIKTTTYEGKGIFIQAFTPFLKIVSFIDSPGTLNKNRMVKIQFGNRLLDLTGELLVNYYPDM